MKKILIILFVIIYAIPAFAQRVHIDIQASEFTKFKVAMPAFTGPKDLAEKTWSICAKDIAMSGVFNLINPKSYINPGPLEKIEVGTLKDWSLIGADYVITGSVNRQGPKCTFEVEIIELSSARILVKNIYTTNEDTIYLAIHRFMDSFLDNSLGLSPVFSSKIIAVKKQQGKKQLYLSWCDGTGGRLISGGGDLILNPTWSPDGKKISFVSYYRDNPDLYLIDLSTYKVSTVSAQKGINTAPTFHPSGSRIACTLSIDGRPNIYLMDLNGANRERLTDSWGTDTSPSFSPDGKSMVFCSSRSGNNPQIYIMDMSSKKVERITFNKSGYDSEPVFSPKGDLIAFSTIAEDKKFHIALIRPDGTKMKVLQGTGKGDEAPTFSPDGRLIAFAASDGDIYITDFLGTSPVRITEGGGFSEPNWSISEM